MGIIGEIESTKRACDAAVRAEHARLRPLLERCEALARAQLHLHQRLRRPDAEAIALFENLLADLRRELGKDAG